MNVKPKQQNKSLSSIKKLLPAAQHFGFTAAIQQLNKPLLSNIRSGKAAMMIV